MADKNLVLELRRWATEEFSLPSDSLPNNSYFKTLCVGTGKSIWKYVIQHVFQQRNVRIIRGNLRWYKVLQNKELKQVKNQSESAKRNELQRKIEQLRAEITHLDSHISETEEQVATQEESISCTWAQVEDCQQRELLLQAYRQRCFLGRNVLCDDAQKFSGHCHVLEQMAKKVEMEVLFDVEASNSRGEGNLNYKTTVEPQVLREVRELCDGRVHFYQLLQESELKTQNSAAKPMACEQKTAVFQHWLCAVEDVVKDYPPSHVLSALQYLASRDQRDLEERIASLDVTRDATALRFRYENDHLLDMSAEEDDDLPPVKTLFEAAWKEVQQSWVELAQTRSRVKQLKHQLEACKEEAEEEVQMDTSALSALEVELQCVMQAAVRDHVREWCIHLDQLNRNQQEALRSLRSQWQSILDFRNQVILRQEQIRGLIKGNSMAKTQLIKLHQELQGFIQSELMPQFGDVITAASSLRNGISKEAKQLGTIFLPSLNRRNTEGLQRIPASWLSIHRLQSPAFSTLCQSLMFPLYKAPEELCSQTCAQQLELRLLRQLQQLHSATLQKVQKDAEHLQASNQIALLSKITEEDQKLLKSLLPRVRGLTHQCEKGLSYGGQVKTAISYWWEKPAQYVLPEVTKGGLTFQQWLQRWKLAAKAS